MAIFDAVGDMLGDILGTSNKGQINAAKNSLDEILAKADATSAQNKQLLGQYLQEMKGTYGKGSQAYSDAVKNLSDAISDYGTYDKTETDFLDPAREMRTQQAMDAIESSASAGGNRFSSNYLDKLAAKQQALASDEWQKAFERYKADRAQALNEQQQKINNAGTLAGTYGQDRTALANALGDYYGALTNQNTANLQAYSDVATNKSNLEAQKTNGIWPAVGGISQIVGSFF